MSREGTKIPSPMARIIEMLKGDDKSGLAETVTNIGAALSAAGVVFSAGPSAAAALGQLAIETNMPSLGGQGISRA